MPPELERTPTWFGCLCLHSQSLYNFSSSCFTAGGQTAAATFFWYGLQMKALVATADREAYDGSRLVGV
jgi:hypothetical protein